MKAGAFTPAILESPGFALRLEGRSMKAGAFTPAIPADLDGHDDMHENAQ